MRSFVICVALLGACEDRDVSHLTAVKDQVCACKTSACAEAAMKASGTEKIESEPRTQALAQAMVECIAKLYDGERPSTDPDVPIDPGSAAPASAGTP